jgi:hypothetical protein
MVAVAKCRSVLLEAARMEIEAILQISLACANITKRVEYLAGPTRC